VKAVAPKPNGEGGYHCGQGASRLPINDRLITAETAPTDTRGIRIPF
jgi:hypothetical protein